MLLIIQDIVLLATYLVVSVADFARHVPFAFATGAAVLVGLHPLRRRRPSMGSC